MCHIVQKQIHNRTFVKIEVKQNFRCNIEYKIRTKIIGKDIRNG